jgi:Domain of unknown function (DUF4267)
MSVKNGLAIRNLVRQPSNRYIGPPFKLRDLSRGANDICPACPAVFVQQFGLVPASLSCLENIATLGLLRIAHRKDCIISSVARLCNKERCSCTPLFRLPDHCDRLFLSCVTGTNSGRFGLKPPAPDADTCAWLRLKGIRDIASGLTVLTLMLTTDSRTVGIVLLVLAIISFGDMSNVMGSGDHKPIPIFAREAVPAQLVDATPCDRNHFFLRWCLLLAVDFSLERRNCAGLELRFDGLCGLESCRVCGFRLGCSMQPIQGVTQRGECIGALWR